MIHTWPMTELDIVNNLQQNLNLTVSVHFSFVTHNGKATFLMQAYSLFQWVLCTLLHIVHILHTLVVGIEVDLHTYITNRQIYVTYLCIKPLSLPVTMVVTQDMVAGIYSTLPLSPGCFYRSGQDHFKVISPVKRWGNLMGRITASLSASLAPSRPATSLHFTLGRSITMAPGKFMLAWNKQEYPIKDTRQHKNDIQEIIELAGNV